MRECQLFAYRFDAGPFHRVEEPQEFWVATETVIPLGVDPVGDLVGKHEDAGIELRLVDDLLALWDDVIKMPGIDFSGIRLRNATRP
jgi:hypothetical protein